MVTLLHLSDIHFRSHSGDAPDIDRDLRNELELDAKRMQLALGSPTAVLVGGDIAFSGSATEFEIAKGWLHNLCSMLGVTFANVWCVPGNHDVDQKVVRQSQMLLDIQNLLRGAGSGIDGKIAAYLRDASLRDQLYQSIAAFNSFAETYGYAISATQPMSRTDLTLNDGSTLRINGLNSTLVSNHLDNTHKKIVLGRLQLPERKDGVTHLVLCHHPPDWWGDDDVLEEDFNRRAHIQLYGHKHRQAVRQINNSVRVVAGAVHPDRSEPGWRPRYNWLTVEVVGSGDQRKLAVKVYPRVWPESAPQFSADYTACEGAEFLSFTLNLDPWEPAAKLDEDHKGPIATVEPSEQPTEEAVKPMNSPLRVITFRLFELPYLTRLDIARRLNLVRNEDAGLRDYEVFKRVLQRASDEGQLAKLWDLVEAEHADQRFPVNPFRDGEDNQ